MYSAYRVASNINSVGLIVGESSADNTETVMPLIVMLSNLLLFSGIILTVISIIKKEKKDYKFFVSVIGYGLFLVITIASLI